MLNAINNTVMSLRNRVSDYNNSDSYLPVILDDIDSSFANASNYSMFQGSTSDNIEAGWIGFKHNIDKGGIAIIFNHDKGLTVCAGSGLPSNWIFRSLISPY